MIGKTKRIQIRVTGASGETDGYVEMLLGMLHFTNVLVSHNLSKKRRAGGVIQIYMDLVLRPAPIGNLGENDMKEYEGDQE